MLNIWFRNKKRILSKILSEQATMMATTVVPILLLSIEETDWY